MLLWTSWIHLNTLSELLVGWGRGRRTRVVTLPGKGPLGSDWTLFVVFACVLFG